MNGKYFMTVETDHMLEILLYGDITSRDRYKGDMSGYTLAKLIQESQAGEILVRINSYGGEVAEGLAIYNSLKNHSAKIKTVCDGFACSAASLVFMAGDERVMNAASLLMIHNAWNCAAGNADELRKAAEDLDKVNDAAKAAYRAVMSITEEELKELMDNETWILPEEALTYGFATALQNTAADGNQPSQSVREKLFQALKEQKNSQMPEKDAQGGQQETGGDAGTTPQQRKKQTDIFKNFKR